MIPWLRLAGPLLIAGLGLFLGLYIGSCRADQRARALRQELNAQRNHAAEEAEDRLEALDSLRVVTARLVVVEESAGDLRERGDRLAGLLAKADERLAFVQEALVTLRLTLETQGEVEAVGDSMVRATFAHETPQMHATTRALLRRPGGAGDWMASERFELDYLALPIVTGLVWTEDGALEARSTCDSVASCQVFNRTPPRIAAEELVEGLAARGYEAGGGKLLELGLLIGAGYGVTTGGQGPGVFAGGGVKLGVP